MNVKELTRISLLLAVGFVLHAITPGYGAGMKPDLLLVMLFVIILTRKDSFKTVITAGAVAGLIGAMTTTFPGGQLPNIIDKVLTTAFVFFLVRLLGRFLPATVVAAVAGGVGTLFSGVVFLTSASLLVGLPAGFQILVATVVIPSALFNIVLTPLVLPLVNFAENTVNEKSLRRAG